MSDESQNTPKEEAPQYEPQPRGEARIPGISIEAVDARLAECAEYFQKHCDETDYRNLDWYLWRMQLRYAAGDDIFEVVDDAFLAARCLHDKHTMHLELKPPEMFMTRRIVPVELGILSGMPMLTLEFSATYGLPLMMVLGQTAPEDIMGEANLMTSFFRRGFCADFVELTGLSAVIYAGVIAAIGRGFDDEATLGLSTYARARDSLRGMPPTALLAKIKRYDSLNTALACICGGKFDMVGEILASAADAFAEEQARRAGDAWLSPNKMPPPKYFDMSILTIIALAVLRGEVIELPDHGAIAGYRDFIRGLTEMPERRIEIPGLDEETRRILEQAGIDPDQMGVDHTYEDEKAASEARAAELFEERQRRAQEYVRAKIAQGIAEEEAHTSVEPEKLGQEKLALHEGEDADDAAKQPKSYADFFSEDDSVDAAARQANEDASETQERETRDYASFFEGDERIPGADAGEEDGQSDTGKDFSGFFNQESREDDSLRANLEEENAPRPEPTENKDFSDFFSQDSQEDDSIRTHVEEESVQAADSGRSYASFFDNLSEDAIPKYDDGSEDVTESKTFTSDFFEKEHHVLSGLKMTLDEPEPEPEPESEQIAEPEAAAPAESEEDRERAEMAGMGRDFSKFFEETTQEAASDLQMSLDEEPTESKDVPASEPVHAEVAEPEQVRESESTPQNADETYSDASVSGRDYSKFFEQEDERRNYVVELDHDAQLRELELEQEQKKAQHLENQKLKLALDGTEKEVQVAESYQARLERLMAEKQAAAREQALREREEAERELEELRRNGVARPVIEQLQLKPTESTDPDEQTEKVAPEDLVIKGFAYTDLDMIHANTAVRDDEVEDFDLHAAVAKQQFEEAQAQAEKNDAVHVPEQDEDLHVVIDYGSLAGNKSERKDE